MRLVHRLQQLGTVGAIDYEAYAEPLAQPDRGGARQAASRLPAAHTLVRPSSGALTRISGAPGGPGGCPALSPYP